MDVDNIPKPILDALKGVVYSDDRQVTDLLCRKRALRGALRIHNPSPLLIEAFAKGRATVHIAVAQSSDRELTP